MRYPLALALSILAVAFFGLTAAGSIGEHSFGFTTVPSTKACELMVTAASTGGAGLHAGDMIDARRLTPHERLRLMVPRAQDSMMLPARRISEGGGMAMVMAVPDRTPNDAGYLRVTILFVLMLLGLYVLWRGRDAASFGLGVFFAMIPAFFLSHAYAGLPDGAIVSVLFLSIALNLAGYLGLYFMVDALAGRVLPPRLRSAGHIATGSALLLACAILLSNTYGRIYTGCPPVLDVQIVIACYAVVIAACFLFLWLGIVRSKAGQRGRLRWVFWATVIGFSGPLLSFAAIVLRVPVPLHGLLNLSFLAIPVGYTYAVLRHRVIDVGFVLNRALSLTILTTAVVVLFAIAESIIEHLALGHVESMVLQLGFSLSLGMVFNTAHAWLEGRLERVLFRRQYVLEASLRELTVRLDTFPDEASLMRAVVTTLQPALGLRGAAIYREAGERFELAAAAGAPAFARECIAGDLSFPLSVRGRAYGGLILREDPEAEALAAEELGLLRTLALHLSAAIAALRAEKYEQLLKAGSP